MAPGIAASSLLEEWKHDPDAQRERSAMERYDAIAKRFEAAKDDRGRRALRSGVELIVRQFEGTQAAKLATVLLRKIQ